MSILEAIILGIVQGVTEFLPISSSGHLIITGKLLGIYSLPMSFELAVHLATLLAVVIALLPTVLNLAKKPLQKKTALLIVATIPTVIIFFIFRSVFEASLSGEWLAICFMITAVLIYASSFKKSSPLKSEPSFFDAVIIGVAQGMAGFAGISRSGSTISVAKILGNDSKHAAEFSFLLSIPIIVGSSILEFATNPSAMAIGFAPILAGFFAAFVSGFICVKFMLKLLANRSMDGFAIYLTLLSIFLLVNQFFLHLF